MANQTVRIGVVIHEYRTEDNDYVWYVRGGIEDAIAAPIQRNSFGALKSRFDIR